MNPFKIFAATLSTSRRELPLMNKTLYDIKLNSLQDNPINLKDFEGKFLLFVNVASKCGFTGQYKDLQELSDLYKDQLQVIGVPCNQFGGQEPGSAEDIESFCQLNYGVDFLMTEKLNVKGTDQHPIYQWLTKKINNGVSDSSVKWNFQKYLVDPSGSLVDYYYSATQPMSKKIIKYLKK